MYAESVERRWGGLSMRLLRAGALRDTRKVLNGLQRKTFYYPNMSMHEYTGTGIML